MVQGKIILLGSLFSKIRSFKNLILPLLCVGYLFLVLPNILWAQAEQWPWTFVGGNFQITNNFDGDFLPAIASDNQNIYLAVWHRKTSSGFDIYGARITKDGKVLDKGEDQIRICAADDDQIIPSVVWDGENFLVVWQDRRSGKRWDIYGARVTPDGDVLDLDPEGISGKPISIGKSSFDQVAPSIFFNRENYLVAWQGKRNSKTWNIYFKIFKSLEEAMGINPVQVNPSQKDQGSPAVAFDGENYMIVWQDKRNGNNWDIYGIKVTRSGALPDNKKGVLISTTSPDSNISGKDNWRPIISWDGNFFLIIWMTSIENMNGSNGDVEKDVNWYLEGQRLSADFGFVDPQTVSIQKGTTNKTFPDILWNGKEYLLVWEDNPEGEPKIFGAAIISQVNHFGISESVQISSTVTPSDVKESLHPVVARIGEEALVVWQAKDPDDSWQIFGQRLKRLGTRSSSTGSTEWNL